MRALIPAFVAMIATILIVYMLPMSLRNIAPPLGLSVIFFYRKPDLSINIQLWAVVIVGVLIDILQAMPVGVATSAALFVYILSRQNQDRDNVESFAANCMRYIWVSAIAMLWIYLLMSLFQGQFFHVQAPLFQWLALVISYPLICSLCYVIYRAIDKASMYKNYI